MNPAPTSSYPVRPAEPLAPPAGWLTEAGPEMRLLIECVRASGAEPEDEGIRRAVAAGPDWDLVRGRAAWHGVFSMLASTLTRNAPDLVPPPLLEDLRRRPRATAVRNLFLLSHLVSLLARLREREIPAVAFKGSFLAHTAYEDPSLREFSDLDIVVRKRDVPRAARLLESVGFAARTPGGEGRRPRAAEWAQYARPYDRSSDGVTVDLHWHLARATFRAGIPMQRLWQETRTYEIGGTPVRSFTPEATLLVLCIHGTKHGPTPWPRLKWVVDVDRVVRSRPKVDWAGVCRLADGLGCRRILWTGLSLAAEVLNSPVPHSLLDRACRDAAVRDIVEKSRRSLLHDPQGSDTAPRDIVYRLALRERWRDKMSTVLRGVVLPQRDDWRLVRLPAGLDFVYVPIRVLRLVGKLLFRGQLGSPAAARLRGRETTPGRDPGRTLEGRLGAARRVVLAVRICACWAAVRARLHRRQLPELIARLDRAGGARIRLEPRRLGRIVYRVMNSGPFHPRCLTMSLVLFRELRRQGTPAEIIIGLPREPKDHTAHAWVEVDRQVVGPPPGRLGHTEMARYGSPSVEPSPGTVSG